MITQRITYNADGSAELRITAEPQAMPEVQSLADELALRPNVTTEGEIHILPPAPDPTGDPK